MGFARCVPPTQMPPKHPRARRALGAFKTIGSATSIFGALGKRTRPSTRWIRSPGTTRTGPNATRFFRRGRIFFTPDLAESAAPHKVTFWTLGQVPSQHRHVRDRGTHDARSELAWPA